MPTGPDQPVKVKEEDEEQQLERNPTPGDDATGTSLSKSKDCKFETDCDEEWQPQVSGEGKRRREEDDDDDDEEMEEASLDDMEEEDADLTESEDSDDDLLVELECDGEDADWVLCREEIEGDDEEEEATDWSSSSQRKAAGQPRGSAASGGQGSTGADEEGGPWLDEGTEDHLPSQPKFWPMRSPGPQIIRGTHTTLQLFRLFFTDTILRTVVRNTNKYGAIHHADRWTDISLEDLLSYMSVLIFMGITQLPSVTDYWRQVNLYNLPFPRSMMSCLKFQLISTAIHMSDPEDDAKNEARRGTPEYDVLHKIKPLYTELREACKSNFHPHQHIRVDERAVCSRVQKDQQHKWGYKLFVLTDCRCGYTWDFHMNEGRAEMATGPGLSHDAVMELLSTEPLGSGYKMYVDNLNNSPEAFKDLLQQKIWACGTIGSTKNNKGFPADRPGSLDKKSPRGSIRWIREDPLLFVQWRDNCDVQMCSTMHQAHAGETIQRKVKGADGKWLAQDIPVPPAVKDFCKRMGGANLSDVLTSSYNVPHKSRKGYRTLFFHFIDLAIVNAFVLHKETALSKGQTPPPTQKAFREELVMELAKAGCPTAFATPEPPPAPVGGMHLPAYYGGDATQVRRRCTVCQQKTPVFCQSCDRPFCLVSDRNCYAQWHEQNFP